MVCTYFCGWMCHKVIYGMFFNVFLKDSMCYVCDVFEQTRIMYYLKLFYSWTCNSKWLFLSLSLLLLWTCSSTLLLLVFCSHGEVSATYSVYHGEREVNAFILVTILDTLIFSYSILINFLMTLGRFIWIGVIWEQYFTGFFWKPPLKKMMRSWPKSQQLIFNKKWVNSLLYKPMH